VVRCVDDIEVDHASRDAFRRRRRDFPTMIFYPETWGRGPFIALGVLFAITVSALLMQWRMRRR
jgi:hypothetical protein